jgi:hypothetical protein
MLFPLPGSTATNGGEFGEKLSYPPRAGGPSPHEGEGAAKADRTRLGQGQPRVLAWVVPSGWCIHPAGTE